MGAHTVAVGVDHAEPLRIAVLTRTGRRSGMQIAGAIHATPHTLCGVVAEKRWTMIRSMIRRRSPWTFLRDYLPGAIIPRLWDGPRRALRPATQSDPVPASLCHVVDSLNSPATIARLNTWSLDLLVVANAPIIKETVMQSARLGAVNFHSGKLPEYGGVASEFWSLYDRHEVLTVSLHRVTTRLDSGDILAEWPVTILKTDTPGSLHEHAIDAAVAGIGQVLNDLAAGKSDCVRSPGPATCRRWPSLRQCWTLKRRYQAMKR